MTDTLDDLRRVAEIEFGGLVAESQPLDEKLRLYLSDGSYIDLWLSRRLHERFGFHWERRHLDGTFYRYDNFPNTAWRDIASYPHHFHAGAQDTVISTPFATELRAGFREFMRFVAAKVSGDR
jgi:hypothetical protein